MTYKSELHNIVSSGKGDTSPKSSANFSSTPVTVGGDNFEYGDKDGDEEETVLGNGGVTPLI